MSRIPEVRVALAGLGTVGTVVARLLQEQCERYKAGPGRALRLAAILDRSYASKDLSWVGSEVRITDSLEEFLQIPADIVVELIGGTDPADQIISDSLKRHKAVVTANKLLVARNGVRYLKLASEQDAYLGFEACVGGGIPIVRVLQRCLFADRITRLRGILNGTCNFILSEMTESRQRFEAVLKQAQRLGYAEAEPTLDVSGQDTRDKLAILSALAFGQWVNPDEIPTSGITEIHPVDLLYAKQLKAAIKLLGIGERVADGLSLRVSPFLVRRELPLSKIAGVYNAVEVASAMVGSTVFSGRGAGGDPTAISVLADILNAALVVVQRNRSDGQTLAQQQEVGTISGSARAAETYPFYIRFFVKDQPGIIAALSGILAREAINIDSVVQERGHDVHNLPFVITVGPTAFSRMQKAVTEMSQLEFNNTPPLALPILSD